MTETYTFRQLRKKLKGFPIKLLRIETGQSLPDLFYYSEQDKFHGWIELKHVRTFNTDSVVPDWRPGQIKRCRELYKSGEQVWVFIGSDDKKEVVPVRGFFLPSYDTITWKPRILASKTGLELYDLLRLG